MTLKFVFDSQHDVWLKGYSNSFNDVWQALIKCCKQIILFLLHTFLECSLIFSIIVFIPESDLYSASEEQI